MASPTRIGMLEARQGQCPVGLLGFLVARDHSAADIAAGRCGRAATKCIIPLHPRPTVLTDLRDHTVRLVKRQRATLPGLRMRRPKQDQ